MQHMRNKIQSGLIKAVSLIFSLAMLLLASPPVHAQADTLVPLSSLTAGDTVKFGGYSWTVVNPGTGYLLMEGYYGSAQMFDTDYSTAFDPTDTSNIAYYLNTTFYNSLPAMYQSLIESHDWTTGIENDESSSTVNCKIGLISNDEWKSNNWYYTNNTTRINILSNLNVPFWTRTPYNYMCDYYVNSNNYDSGSLVTQVANQFAYARYVRPALYLNPGILVDRGDMGTVKPYYLTVSTSASTAGTPLNVTVTVADAFGNTAADYTGTVHFTCSDATALLPTDYTFTGSGTGKDNGSHTFSKVTLKTAGSQTITATDLTLPTTYPIITASSNLTVSPSAAVSIAVTSSTTIASPTRMPFNVTVTVLDTYGNTVIDFADTVRLSCADINAELPGDYTFTGSGTGKDNGSHTFNVILKTTGEQRVIVTDLTRGSLVGSTGLITVPPSSVKDITSLTVPGQAAPSIIDSANHAVTFHMPYGYDSSQPMTPTISVSAAAAVSPASGTPRNFSSTLSYTVTAEDSSTQTWTVACIFDSQLANDILGFTVPGQVGSSIIDTANRTLTFHMPYGTDVSSLEPTIITSTGAALSPFSGTVEDFRNPVTYQVTARDTSTWPYTYSPQTWTVICVVDPQPLSALSLGDTVNFGGYLWTVLDPSTGCLLMQDFDSILPNGQAFDPNGTNIFDPDDQNNIAYYLNDTFYKSLPSADQVLIQPYYWTTGNEQNETSSTVNCKIGLLSYSECQKYSSLLGRYSAWQWTRTPFSGSSSKVFYWVQLAMMTSGGDPKWACNVRPVLYLNPDILISGGNGGTVDAAVPTITTQPQDVTAAEGQTATFSVAAAGYCISYQWQKSSDGVNWNNISSGTGQYTVGVLSVADSGIQYRCVITNTLNGTTAAATSNAATLAVNPITTVSVEGFAVPSGGVTPEAAGALISGDPSRYTVASLTWSPADSPFKADTFYTATVVLTSTSNYSFCAALTPTVDAGTTAIGAVSGIGPGNTLTFTVSFPVPVTNITVTGAGSATSVQNRSTLQMSAAILPATATDPRVTWSVIPETGMAIIDGNGLLTGTAVGTVIVEATASDGSGVSGSLEVTVKAIEYKKIADLSTGDKVQFGGYTWKVLDPSTGYLLMEGFYGNTRAFALNSQIFAPGDTDNIAYYLNDTFYKSLPSADQALIQPYSWTNGNEQDELKTTVDCKVGLLSYSEFDTYKSILSKQQPNYYIWTRTPSSEYARFVWAWTYLTDLADITIVTYPALYPDTFPGYVQPALHLNPDILVYGGNSGTVDASKPTIWAQPHSVTVTAGQTATFSIAAGGDNLSYQWQKSTDGGSTRQDVAGATSADFTTGALTASDSGSLYNCIVTSNLNGTMATATSAAATLTVTQGESNVPVTNITGVPATATAGTPLTLSGTVVPSNATNQTIAWSIQDPGTTGAKISGNKLSTTAVGTVTVRATITNGLTASTSYTQEFTITVDPAPVTSTTLSPNTGSFDKHAPADVTTAITWGSATGVTDVKAGGSSIDEGNYSVSGDTLTIKKEYLAVQATGSLPLTVEFNAGDAATLTISITDTTPPAISPASRNYDLSAPADVMTSITWNSAASVTKVVYSVSPDATLYTLGTGDYTVSDDTLTIKNSFFSGASLTTGAALEFGITFNTGANATLTVHVVNGHTPSDDADLSSVSVNGTPVTGFDPDDTEYAVELPYGTSGATVTVTASDSNAQVRITQASSLPGSATVTVTAEDGSTTKTYTVNLTIEASPTVTGVTVSPSAVSVQKGNTQTFTATVSGINSPAQTVIWSVYGKNSTSTAIDASGLLMISADETAATLTVKATSTADNTKSGTATVTVSVLPVTFVPVTSITGVPPTATVGAPLTLSGTVAPTNATNQTIVWSVYNAGTTGATVSGNTLSTTAPGTIFVRATITNGLTASSDYTQDFTITVNAVPVNTYTVTFNSCGAVYATKTVNAGESIGSEAWPADPTRSSYTFGGWFTGENGTDTQFTSATPVNAATTVYANWAYSGGGGSSSGGGTTSTTQTYSAEVSTSNGSGSTLPITVDKSGGNAKVDVGTGNSFMSDGKVTVVKVPAVSDVDTYTLGIPVPNLSHQNEQGTLVFETDTGIVTVPSNMLTGVAGISGSKAEISIGQGDKASLLKTVKAAIGDRPLVQLSLSIDGKQAKWNNPNAPVSVSIPYTPTADELANPESIVIWYIDGSGYAVSVPNGHYDSASGTVTFSTTHFSNYAVGYNKVSFKDIAANAWYNKAVGFIAARKITTGTGNGNYCPDAKLSRGEFIVMLMRAYSIAADEKPTENFTDAGSTYYTGYLAAAKRLGISVGVGNNMFAPGKEITRQEMFTLLYNALKFIDQLPEGNSGKTLTDFTDVGQIDSWAKDAMTLLVETGTIGGSAGKLNPINLTTRAEMAQVLYNLLAK
jgi:uncharacterized repeat protein (TIGR02543 family)